MSVRRDPLMLLIAVALTPMLSGCFDLGFPGAGVSVRGGPYGGAVNVGFPGGGFNLSGGPMGGSLNLGFPGGGVNVGLGPGGGGVSVAAPGVNLNVGIPGRQFFYQDSGDLPVRSQTALFPPTIAYQAFPPLANKARPAQPAGLPNGWERGEDMGFDDLRSR